mmetsp:Transcript_11546/g.18569  ORF Transcript_11546/g.18569 Transcript_11546/m.18569 type:complete len:171 (-) Transcript_11546:168-680(-)
MKGPTPLQNHTAFVISTVVLAIALLWLAAIAVPIVVAGQVSAGGVMVSAGLLLILTFYPGVWIWGPFLVAGFLPGIWVYRLAHTSLRTLLPGAVLVPNMVGACVTSIVAFASVFIPAFLGVGLAKTNFAKDGLLPMFWDLALLLWVIVPSALIAAVFVMAPQDRQRSPIG